MNKTIRLLGLLLAIGSIGQSYGQWQNESFTHQGNNRQYRVYQSPNYNPSIPASMVITLHGLGDNMTNFSGIGMNYIADTANIIVVVPQAMTDALAGTAWNSGTGMFGYYPNSSINDVAFISALIDTIKANYVINDDRVYACGFSMGGFMTNRLAVELNDKITAFGSVAGTFGFGLPDYQPGRAVSMVHFHGTADETVPYAGNDSGIGADSIVSFWHMNNNCNAVPVHTALPNTQSDGYTVDHYRYTGGDDASEVEFYKVTGANHVWLGPSNDIFYTVELWKFFNRHQTLPVLGIAETTGEELSVFPNPANDHITIAYNGNSSNCRIALCDLSGKELLSTNLPSGTSSVTLNVAELQLSKGLYLIRLEDGQTAVSKKICIE